MISKLIMSILMFLAVLSYAYAAAPSVAFTAPSGAGTFTGIYQMNLTVSDGAYINNCSVYAKSASTANSSYVLMNTSATANGTTYTFGFFSTALEDSNDYIFNATCACELNSTTYEYVLTENTIQNTQPQTPTITSGSPINNAIVEDDNMTITFTVTGSNTTGCTLLISSGASDKGGSMTHTGDSCTKEITSLNEGTIDYKVKATDGTDSATTSNFVVQVEYGKKSNAGAVIMSQQANQAQQMAIVGDIKEQTQEISATVGEFAAKEMQPRELLKTTGGVVAGLLITSFILPPLAPFTVPAAIAGGLIGMWL